MPVVVEKTENQIEREFFNRHSGKVMIRYNAVYKENLVMPEHDRQRAQEPGDLQPGELFPELSWLDIGLVEDLQQATRRTRLAIQTSLGLNYRRLYHVRCNMDNPATPTARLPPPLRARGWPHRHGRS